MSKKYPDFSGINGFFTIFVTLLTNVRVFGVLFTNKMIYFL